MPLSIAMIPLAADAELSGKAIRADFHESWPDHPKPKKSEGKEDTISFGVGDDCVMLGVMPAPIPWDDLEGPCETSWLWPEAKAVLRKHTDHIIVTVMSEDEDPVERAKLLTRVCASVLATCDEALGVYWGDAALVNSSKTFRDFTHETLAEDGLPVYLWVDFRAGKAEDGRTAGFTHGLAALGHREFETESASDTPGDLRERLSALAQYVLENGPVIKDGNTVGGDEYEKIRVELVSSAFGNPKKVLRLEYEAGKKKKKPRRD